MIDLVFLKFVRKCLLFSFFVVFCAFDIYGMNKGLNLGGKYPRGKKNTINESSFNFGEKGKSGHGVYDFSPLYINYLGCLNEYTYLKKILEGSSKNSYPLMKDPYYAGEIDMEKIENTLILRKKKEKEIADFLNNTTCSEQVNKYPFAKTLPSSIDFVSLWKKDFDEGIRKLLPEEAIDDFNEFLQFYFCHKIIKKEDINKSGPFLSDNAEKVEDFLKKDIPLLCKRVCLARRFKIDVLLGITEGDKALYCDEKGLRLEHYINGVIQIFHPNNSISGQSLNENNYMYLYRMFVSYNKRMLNKLFVRDLLSGVSESFTASIVKYRTLLFRFIPTFIYNIFDVGRFLKDFYTYSNDGRYSLSFYNVPLILGKTSPLFFNIFQVDFFLNFPLGIVLSCLDFCAYSILRRNLSKEENARYSSFQKIFLVWRPDVELPFIGEFIKKFDEKEEYHNAFASIVLKVLTNFVGVNFNIKVKDNYFFSINLMSFVDDFILREYFLDSFNYSSKSLRPSSWSIFYEPNIK